MTCQKCKGLMVAERRSDYASEAAVMRCINCGLVLDPLIEENRRLRTRAAQPTLRAA